jgi:hypothetical protein
MWMLPFSPLGSGNEPPTKIGAVEAVATMRELAGLAADLEARLTAAAAALEANSNG